jgi:Flp pilus assembly protein TadD
MRRTDDAITDWTQVTTLAPATPSLFRSLGRIWLDIKGDKATALPILEQGLQDEPNNADLLNAISRAQQ